MAREAWLWIDDEAEHGDEILFDTFDELQAVLSLVIARAKCGAHRVYIRGTSFPLCAGTLPEGPGPIHLHLQQDRHAELVPPRRGA